MCVSSWMVATPGVVPYWMRRIGPRWADESSFENRTLKTVHDDSSLTLESQQ